MHVEQKILGRYNRNEVHGNFLQHREDGWHLDGLHISTCWANVAGPGSKSKLPHRPRVELGGREGYTFTVSIHEHKAQRSMRMPFDQELAMELE